MCGVGSLFCGGSLLLCWVAFLFGVIFVVLNRLLFCIVFLYHIAD